ncbi:MAG: UDP-N-acetylglucosamine 4,6-dehydratase (inverting) [Candidatus Paceibacterota bacterium]|nr:MAG: UDP-N-acetylglucosamine 4,6-dehydratase (inverting) [Candidatus Paceibacterota bacterium]
MKKNDFLKNKTLLITGGTGSFGKNFARHLLENHSLKKLIVFSRDELKQSVMAEEFKDDRVRFFLGDIRDLSRLQRAFHGVDIIVHAAALKQVPTLEYNPIEAVKTNVLGTQNVIEAAVDQGVSKVLLVSTDKAAQPVNLYGSTKLCAEKLFIASNVYAGEYTKFSCVRYGNVIGSRGSIIEILLKNKNKESICLTDERMTRFWLRLEESFQLVLFALKQMEGGEIFIPKKVPSMSIKDIFETIAPNLKKEVSGIRPGEKIHEVLLTAEEARHSLELDSYFVILPEHKYINSLRFKKHKTKGKKIPADFSFTSDTNTLQMSRNDLLKIAKELEKQML